MKRLLLALGLTVMTVSGASAQETDQNLARHNFFYAGQSKQRRMFIVKDGQVSWAYQDRLKRGEISDAVLMSDGHILVAHQFVVGKSGDPELGGSESLGTQNVGLIEKIGYDCFDDFDYVALGHIHSPQQAGRKEVRYSGSPLKYSLSEVNNQKSVSLVTVDATKNVTVELVPIKPMRDLRHLKGKFKDLLAKQNVTAPEDFIYATLTDEEFIQNAMAIFQQTYPNTVKIDYDNSRTRQTEQIDISRIAENRSFEDLISDFYRQMYNCGISEEEMDIMRTAAREAGVLYEAD